MNPSQGEQNGPADDNQPQRVVAVSQDGMGVRSAPLEEAGRARLAEIHRSISELEQGLAPELIDEIQRITLAFNDKAPSDADLHIARAQLVGWLERLSHGIQTALFAQQMADQQRLQSMVDVGAATARYRVAHPGQDRGPGQGPGPVPGMPDGPVSPDS